MTPNRPLYAYCDRNQQCGDSCCGATDNQCVPPLLDCQGQLPLWAFNVIMGGVFLVLIALYLVVDWLEKKRRQHRYDKIKKKFGEEYANQLEEENMLNSTTSVSASARLLPSQDESMNGSGVHPGGGGAGSEQQRKFLGQDYLSVPEFGGGGKASHRGSNGLIIDHDYMGQVGGGEFRL